MPFQQQSIVILMKKTKDLIAEIFLILTLTLTPIQNIINSKLRNQTGKEKLKNIDKIITVFRTTRFGADHIFTVYLLQIAIN